MPAAASGHSNGEISWAGVDAQWTFASIAGAAERTHGCSVPVPGKPDPWEPEPPLPPSSPPWTCGWIPYVTSGPGSSVEDCSALDRRLGSLGEGIQLIWAGPELMSVGTAEFDLENVPLEGGADAPLLCLSAVEAVLARRVCIPEIKCPPVIVHEVTVLDAALLEISATRPPDGSVPGDSADAGPVPESSSNTSPAGAPASPPSTTCHRQHRSSKRTSRSGGIGLAEGIPVERRPKTVRRCKTG
jgi:hypothetical protein